MKCVCEVAFTKSSLSSLCVNVREGFTLKDVMRCQFNALFEWYVRE